MKLGWLVVTGVLLAVLAGQVFGNKRVMRVDPAHSDAPQIKAIFAGSELNFAFAEFDAWLEDLETGRSPLSQMRLQNELDMLVDAAREAGASEKEINKRIKRVERFLNSVKV